MENKKYNEKILIKKFLCSKDGLKFLNSNTNIKQNKERDIDKEIDNILDYYMAWTMKMPVRKSSKMTKYEFMKYLEDFCEKNKLYRLFDFLYH